MSNLPTYLVLHWNFDRLPVDVDYTNNHLHPFKLAVVSLPAKQHGHRQQSVSLDEANNILLFI